MIINDPVKITGIVDILIIIIFTSLGFRGFLRGFIKEISGFAEVFVLILLLYKKTEEFRRFVEPIIELSYIQALLVFFFAYTYRIFNTTIPNRINNKST